MNVSKEQLIEEFRDPEYRKGYAEGFLSTAIATQLTVVREQRGLTQSELAKLLDMQQEGISRIENENYGRWNIRTLLNVAFALGTRLKISLETFGTLVDEAVGFSPESLHRPSFDEDPVFAPAKPDNPVQWIRDLVLPWLDGDGDQDTLIQWLQGRNLRGIGHSEEPYIWLLRALPENSDTYKHRMASRVADLLKTEPDVHRPGRRPDQLLANLLFLAAGLESPEELSGPVFDIYLRVAKRPDSLDEDSRLALLAALTRNQADTRLKKVWLAMIENDRDVVLPGDKYAGFAGLKYLPPKPDLPALAEGLKLMEEHFFREPDKIDRFVALLRSIKQTHISNSELATRMLDAAYDAFWSDWAVVAWVRCFAPDAGTKQELIRNNGNIAPDFLRGVLNSENVYDSLEVVQPIGIQPSAS